MATQSYVISVYMNEDFKDMYFTPFLKIALNDENLGMKAIRFRKKRGKKEVIPEIESPAIRALIKKYVEHHKKKMLNNQKTEEDGSN